MVCSFKDHNINFIILLSLNSWVAFFNIDSVFYLFLAIKFFYYVNTIS